MNLPLHALDTVQFERAQQLLGEEWLAQDAELAPLLPVVLARGVGQDWHKSGTFRHHLAGVARALTLWQQPREVRLLGLLHSVYGNAFVDLVKFDASSERGALRALVGEQAEHLIYLFCTISRTEFTQKLQAHATEADGTMEVAQGAQRITLTPREVAAFAIVTMADAMEQWSSWQDDVYSRFPYVNPARQQSVHWASSLWPGPMRPTSRIVSQINAWGRALQHPVLRQQLPLPPMLAQCTAELTAGHEAAAMSLYWSVIQMDQPLVEPDCAIAVLEQAVRLNPWVGEPQMVLAQLYLAAGRPQEAERAAASAVHCYSCWGNAWDKRVQWDAWMAWARIVRQSAQQGTWPDRLDKLNNMALRQEVAGA